MAQISLAWMLSKPGVTAPIIGTTSLSNLEDILGESIASCHRCLSSISYARLHHTEGSLDVTLTDEEVKYLEEPYQPLNVIGHS